ncbi:MAG: hypothetical protein LBR34_04840 [Prevotella sp.]|nr:hypothetical protein [Prevotella sp.]
MEKKFSEQDSLQLINEMIAQARDNVRKGAGDSMITAGYVVAFTAFADFLGMCWMDNTNMAHWVWSLMLPYFIVCLIRRSRRDRTLLVRTHIDKIVSWTWTAFGYTCYLVLAVIFSMVYLLHTWEIQHAWVVTLMITPILLTLMGLAQFITAKTCRFRPFIYAAYVFWAGVIVDMALLILFADNKLQFIVLALCAIFGFIVPGHILNRKATDNV